MICSYQFAKAKAKDIKEIAWDLVVLGRSPPPPAQRLQDRQRHRQNAQGGDGARVHSKVLLTATPLQNSLLELYGLVSIIDDRVFGDLDSFRAQFASHGREPAFGLCVNGSPPCAKVHCAAKCEAYVSYTARRAIVQEFTPSNEEQELSRLVADYLRRPNLMALPQGQRQLISLVLWKLLASSTHAIAGALETMAKRLQGVLDASPVVDLTDELDEDYEALDETAEEFVEGEDDSAQDSTRLSQEERTAIADEIDELRHFKKAWPPASEKTQRAKRCSRRWIAPLPSWIAWAQPRRPSSSPNPGARRITF